MISDAYHLTNDLQRNMHNEPMPEIQYCANVVRVLLYQPRRSMTLKTSISNRHPEFRTLQCICTNEKDWTKHIKATQFMKLPGNNWIISPRIEKKSTIFDNTGKHISKNNINIYIYIYKHQISRSLEKSCCIQDACKPTIVLFSSKPSARIWPQLGLHISPRAEMTQGDKSAGENQNFLAGCFVEELDE